MACISLSDSPALGAECLVDGRCGGSQVSLACLFGHGTPAPGARAQQLEPQCAQQYHIQVKAYISCFGARQRKGVFILQLCNR